MQKFISCDWGTSALRLKVVDGDEMTVLAETASEQGISSTFDLWKQSRRQEEERLFFYQSFLKAHILKLEEQLKFSLQNVPLIISGMASSNIGMLELPYKPVPVNSKENDFVIKIVEASDNFKHKMLVISGVKTSNDVMRGEETQLIGCLKDDHRVNQYFIFTGTHSKHVLVENEMIVDLKTYMTGEFFSLLSKKSVLSSVIEEGEDFRDENNMKSFEAGVKNSLDLNLLHSAFLVRTNHILGKLSKRENFFYLSGLLIGSEIKDLPHDHEHIVLVSNKLLTPYYAAAFKILNKGSAILKVKNIDEALLKGQFKIYSFYSSLLV